MRGRIEIVEGDITRLDVDAIVNAANRTLLGGGGVDGAIHRAAGPELRAACAKLGGCETGNAKMSPGFGLLARHVIHTVGPIYGREPERESELLASCYRNSLLIAREHQIASIAFPSISTGAFGYPKPEAAKISSKTIREYLTAHAEIEHVRLVFFQQRDARVFLEYHEF